MKVGSFSANYLVIIICRIIIAVKLITCGEPNGKWEPNDAGKTNIRKY